MKDDKGAILLVMSRPTEVNTLNITKGPALLTPNEKQALTPITKLSYKVMQAMQFHGPGKVYYILRDI